MDKRWTIGFFSALAVAIGLELLAVFDKNDNTTPLTSYIITYVPSWIGLPAIGAFCVWLFFHFKKWYSVKNRKK